MNIPSYKFKGKAYKTVAGICNALAKDSGAVSVGMVHNGTIKVYAADKSVITTYAVSPPKLGEDMIVTRMPA